MSLTYQVVVGKIVYRKRSFGEKPATELMRLVVKLVVIVAALWPGLFVLPGTLTAVFLDAMDLPPAP